MCLDLQLLVRLHFYVCKGGRPFGRQDCPNLMNTKKYIKNNMIVQIMSWPGRMYWFGGHIVGRVIMILVVVFTRFWRFLIGNIAQIT